MGTTHEEKEVQVHEVAQKLYEISTSPLFFNSTPAKRAQLLRSVVDRLVEILEQDPYLEVIYETQDEPRETWEEISTRYTS